jgi:hypothetical protein
MRAPAVHVVKTDGRPLPDLANDGGGAVDERCQAIALANQDVLAVHAKPGAGEVARRAK